jgi:hypothetical protein
MNFSNIFFTETSMEEIVYKDALFDDQPNGRLVFVMLLEPVRERLYFFVGIGQGMNNTIDVNNAVAHGMSLSREAGISIFFGDWND